MNISQISTSFNSASGMEDASAAMRGGNRPFGGSGALGSLAGGGGASLWELLTKLADKKQEAVDKADSVVDRMSADDNEATKSRHQRDLSMATSYIESLQKMVEKVTEVTHTTSNGRL